MYADWSSLTVHLQLLSSSTSILSKLPNDDAKSVVHSVIKNVASTLGLMGLESKPSKYNSEKEILWIMEVISHGLSLSFTEHELIKDCVNIYCEWLSALLPSPKNCVPLPITEESNRFSRLMIKHLFHLFVPRKGEEDKNGVLSEKSVKTKPLAHETIHRQAVLCHRVLRRIQDIAQQSEIMEHETWETLLAFLLAINDSLLAPPTVKDDVGDQLCDRVLGALYEIWLLSCVKSFPGPPLWKTFREMCSNWRHRGGLVDQWNRVNLALTSRLLLSMYGPNYPPLKLSDEDHALVPKEMDSNCVAQTWFRFLHSLGNPVDLSHPSLVSQTQHFYQYAIVAENVIDPTHHPCLSSLPSIFSRAMKGIASIVDAYLGMASVLERESSRLSTRSILETPTPPSVRRNVLLGHLSQMPHLPHITKWSPHGDKFRPSSLDTVISHSTHDSEGLSKTSHCITLTRSISSSASSNIGSTTSLTGTSLLAIERIRLPLHRPTVNSLLHLFGKWLFEASFINTNYCKHGGETRRSPSGAHQEHSRKLSTASGSSQNSTGPDSLELPPALTLERFESGRAEALGALCRIFCSKKTGEDILPIYLTRFYMAIHQGLFVSSDKIISEVLIMIFVNSWDLLRLDLDGVFVLVPSLLTALEHVLSERELKMRPSSVHKNELRRSAIHHLLSMMALPFHFESVSIADIGGSSETTSFIEYRPRIVNLLITALQIEIDAINTQMLLGGLLLCIQDSTLNETPEYVNSHVDSSSYSIFVKTIYSVCHRLISSWKSDLNTSLAALELLGGLARIQNREKDLLECKRAVKWLCDYIIAQCSRPPPAHSKDLHSSIVAAFHCLQLWVLHHSVLLYDKECLALVLDVVELGICGTKSKTKDHCILKEDKILNPASLRVKCAAESLQVCILEQQNSCLAMNERSLSNEVSLLGDSCLSVSESISHFRYFVLDNIILLAITEPRDSSLTLLLRYPSGRYAWSLSLRHLPSHKSGNGERKESSPISRPSPIIDVQVKHEFHPKFFPDSIDRIPLCKADRSIPAVESVACDDRTALELEHLSILMEQQSSLENEMIYQVNQSQKYVLNNECIAPTPASQLQNTRLFLSHLGLLSMETVKESSSKVGARLVALNSYSKEFIYDLESLDQLSCKTNEYVQLFYVKRRQKNLHEILNNVVSNDNLHPAFFEFLRSLGRSMDPSTIEYPFSNFNGSNIRWIFHWEDALNEMRFIVPSIEIKEQSNCFVIWLENIEDAFSLHFLEDESESRFIIFIHPLSNNGLFRIKLQGHINKINLATPLIDGMVVSQGCLGILVRQTLQNMSRRRRLELDNYQPPHVKRKLKVQEIVSKYHVQLSPSAFYTKLFENHL